MSTLIKKMILHLQNGTLLPILISKVRRAQISTNEYRLRYNEYYNNKADSYLKKREHTEGWKKEHNTVVDILNTLPPEIKVLDVPVGTGRFIKEYINRGYSTFGVDISSDMMKQIDVMESGFECVQLHIGDARSLPFKDDFFDLTVTTRFLGYIPPLEDAIIILNEIHRVTKSWVILHLQARTNNYPKGNLPKMGHQQYMDEIINTLKEVGFEVIEIKDIDEHRSGVTNFTAFCKKM